METDDYRMTRSLALVLAASIPVAARAQSFQRIVSSDDLIPGTQMAFGAFNGAVYRNGYVAFRSWTEDGLGLFRVGPAGVEVIAHSSHPLPETVQVDPDIPFFIDNDGTVGFGGWDDDLHYHVMAYSAGNSSTISRAFDPEPGSDQFDSVGGVGLENGRFIIGARPINGVGGFYEVLSPHHHRLILDTNTRVPGTNVNFGSFATNSSPAFRAGRIGFTAYYGGGTMGVFDASDSGITPVVHTGMAAPEGGTLTRFDSPVPGALGTFFLGQTQASRALYLGTSEAIMRIQPIPWGQSVVFDSDGGQVLLWSQYDPSVTSTVLKYWTPETGVIQLLQTGDLIDGRAIQSVWLFPGAFDGSTAVLSIMFPDESRFLYTVTIPAPSTFALPVWLIFASRRRRA